MYTYIYICIYTHTCIYIYKYPCVCVCLMKQLILKWFDEDCPLPRVLINKGSLSANMTMHGSSLQKK